MVKVDKLKPHPEAKKIYDYKSKKEIKVLGKNMKVVGQLEPIFINDKNEIISGHRRYFAALMFGINELKALRFLSQKTQPEDILEEERTAIVFHNQQRKKKPIEIIREAEAILNVLGKNQGKRKDLYGTDPTKFGTIGSDRFEIAAATIGDISGSTLRRLMAVVDYERENGDIGLVEKVIKNEVPISKAHSMMNEIIREKVAREKARTLRTRIVEQTDIFTLYNKSSETMNEVKDKSIQVVFTSPPYYQLRNYGNSKNGGTPELGLETTIDEYINHLSKFFKEVKRVLKDEGSFFLNIADTIRGGENLLIPNRLVLNLCDKQGWHLVNELIWQKTNPIPSSTDGRLQNSYEKIFHLVKKPGEYYYEPFKIWDDNKEVKIVGSPSDRSVKGGKKSKGVMLSKNYGKFKDFLEEQQVVNVIKGHNAATRQTELKKIDPTTDHPALMPLYLPVIPILTTSKEGDFVLDPFSGSGSVGNAAITLGRKYIGYELNKANYKLSQTDLSLVVSERNTIDVPIAEFSN